jgi:hypothetical protein
VLQKKSLQVNVENRLLNILLGNLPLEAFIIKEIHGKKTLNTLVYIYTIKCKKGCASHVHYARDPSDVRARARY